MQCNKKKRKNDIKGLKIALFHLVSLLMPVPWCSRFHAASIEIIYSKTPLIWPPWKGILQPNFLKTFTTFSSRKSASASLGLPIMNRYSHLEYWVLAQRWRSIFMSLRNTRKLTCFVTEGSDSYRSIIVQLMYLLQHFVVGLIELILMR